MWSKLDDGFPDHPKVLAAGPLASWLYVCGVCYCNRLLTDGFIPLGQVRKLADVPDAMLLADTLVGVGLWERTTDGYKVHDFHDINPTADEVRAKREEVSRARSEAGRKGMESRWHKDDNKITNPITNGKQHGLSTGDNKTITQTRPDLNPSLSEDGTKQTSTKPKANGKQTPAPKALEREDNFAPFVERCWQKYPRDKDNRQAGSKAKFVEQVRKLNVAVWDDFERAIEHYGETDRVKRGYVKTAELWVKDALWKNYIDEVEPREVKADDQQSKQPTHYSRAAQFLRNRAAEAAQFDQDDAGPRLLPPGAKPA